MTKFCNFCHTEQNIENFSKSKKSKDGYSTKCKTCSQKYYFDNIEKIRQYCIEHKEQRNAQSAKYNAQKDKEQTRQYMQRYYQEHKEDIRKQQNNYRQENKDIINTRAREALRTNYKQRINSAVQRSIYDNLVYYRKNYKIFLINKWEYYLDYKVEDLMKHLESQFTSEMTWDNYGRPTNKDDMSFHWEIDHIIPRNLFEFDSPKDYNFKICWSLMNLRPLEWRANRSRPKDGSDVSEELKQKILNQDLS